MKKSLFILSVLLLAVAFMAACGGEPGASPADPPVLPIETPEPVADNNTDSGTPPVTDNGDTDDNGSADDTPVALPDFFFKFGEVVITLDENISYVLDMLGEPMGVMVLPSCAFDGDDRIYRFPGVDLYTYPSSDSDFIHTIAFFDDTVRTAEGGIRLGSRLQAVLDAYGDDYTEESGMYTFSRGDTLLEFLIEADSVIGITYRLDIEIQVG